MNFSSGRALSTWPSQLPIYYRYNVQSGLFSKRCWEPLRNDNASWRQMRRR